MSSSPAATRIFLSRFRNRSRVRPSGVFRCPRSIWRFASSSQVICIASNMSGAASMSFTLAGEESRLYGYVKGHRQDRHSKQQSGPIILRCIPSYSRLKYFVSVPLILETHSMTSSKGVVSWTLSTSDSFRCTKPLSTAQYALCPRGIQPL